MPDSAKPATPTSGEAPSTAALESPPLPPLLPTDPDGLAAALDAHLAHAGETLAAVRTAHGSGDFSRIMEPLERCVDRLHSAWAPVRHAHSVMNTPELREAYQEGNRRLEIFASELSQDAGLFRAVGALDDAPASRDLPVEARALVRHWRRELELAGAGLGKSEQERLKAIRLRLTDLSATFSNHVLDASEAFHVHVLDEARLTGLEPGSLAMAAAHARKLGKDGWALGLSPAFYFDAMTTLEDRELRRELYLAHVTRASDTGPDAGRFDNLPLIDEILALRAEQAGLLGFPSYADLSLQRKMADSPRQVRELLEAYSKRARPRALEELRELEELSSELQGDGVLRAWDMAWLSEQYRLRENAVDSATTRDYFPLDHVLAEFFALTGRLLQIEFRARSDVELWHPDAHAIEVRDASGAPLGDIWLDLFGRDGKRGGAWVDRHRSRTRIGDESIDPVAYLTCNFQPPGDGTPCLLTHTDLVTLFHEFGHALHHVLTRVGYPSVGGLGGVEWDAVELPSQLWEQWCYDRDALRRCSRHVGTGAPLPDQLATGLARNRQCLAAMKLLRQLEFGLFDLALHERPSGRDGSAFEPVDPIEVMRGIRSRVAVAPQEPEDRFPCGFGHIFAGGYAAGYYSYLWAERLACDGFEQIGTRARQFRIEVLEVGASRPAAESFRQFLGRDCDETALLRAYGLADSTG